MAKNQYTFNYDNTLPTVIVGEMVITVNNRKSTMKQLQEAKAKAKSADDVDRIIIETLCGKKAADYIEELDLPIPAYQELIVTILAAYNGTTVEKQKEQLNTRF